MTADAVIGRSRELQRIDAFVSDTEHGANALVLSGAPGIGKTVLWEAGVAEAVARGYTVLSHRAVEAEAGMAFSGLTDLLEAVADDVLEQLPPPRRRALEVALLLAEPGEQPSDPRAIGVAFLDVLRVLAAQEPVIVAVDDLQWLDSSSAAVLPPALRRLDDDPVLTLATLRIGPEQGPAFDLTRTFADRRLEELRLRPLDLIAVHRLLADRLGLQLSGPEVARVLKVSGGNPYFALEIGRELARAEEREIRVPTSLRDALGERLGQLPAATVEVLLAASALGRPSVSAATAACAQDPEALDAAVAAGVVDVDGDHVRFTHPLLAAVCYERLLPSQRRSLHARLAAVVEDVEQRARHLALSTEEPAGEVADALEAAAGHAAARGATAAAAELAELASQRTPAADASERRRRQLTAALLHRLSMDSRRAVDLYAALIEELPPGPERADVLYASAHVGVHGIPARVQLCEQALREAADDEARAAQILGYLAISRWLLGDTRAGLRDARDGLMLAERLAQPRVLAIALGRVALLETWMADMTPGVLERSIDIEGGLELPLMFGDSPTFVGVVRLFENDRLDEARSLLGTVADAAAERGDGYTGFATLALLQIVDWYAGRLETVGLQLGPHARALGEQAQEPEYGAWVTRVTALAEAELGLFAQARATAERGAALARSVDDEIDLIGNLAALGHLALLQRDVRAAAHHLRDLPERLAASGHASASLNCSADAVEALVGVGDLEDAERCLATFMTLAPRLNGWARVGAWRSKGLIAAAEGDRDGAVAAFEQALAMDGATPMYPLERGRTLLALGVTLHRDGRRRDARETIERALNLFTQLGATVRGAHAREELARISGRRRRSDGELTSAERRVAALAAQGKRNTEIAAELFIEVGTVERHLTHAYRKLGVRSRTELAGRFAGAGETVAR